MNYKASLALAGSLVLQTVFVISTTVGVTFAEEPARSDQIQDALQGDWGQITMNLSYRFAHVDQDGLKTTNGDPLRLRLGYLTPEFSGFQALVEFEGNTPVFLNDYNDTTNGKTDYAVIADPAAGELNQAWLSFDTIPHTVLKGGRQEIFYDDERFVGAVAWRQLEQTYDAVTLFNTSFGNFSAKGAYVWNVRTVTSQDVNMQSPLLNLNYFFEDIGSLAGYGYWLDYDDPDDSGPFAYAFSTQTIGLRFNGAAAVADNFELLYTAEYASQSDYQDNPKEYTADYYHFIGGLLVPNSASAVTGITGKVGYEVLGADSGVSFKTPLGTNHKFNGRADLFLIVPPDGLRDLYGTLSCTVTGNKVDVTYHDFQADEGGSDYGTGIDVMLTRKIGDHYTVLVAYANYNADEYKTDTQKFWLQLTMAF